MPGSGGHCAIISDDGLCRCLEELSHTTSTGEGLLLREITPHRDRNDNCSGYNQSTDDIFHFAPPLTTRCTTLRPIPSLRAILFDAKRPAFAACGFSQT